MNDGSKPPPRPRLVVSNPSRRQVVESLAPKQVYQLHEMFQKEWWTRGRSLSDIRSMLQNSDLVVGLVDTESESLLAFARVLSDGVFKALVFDVLVAQEYRRQGLGKLLMDHILSHSILVDVKHIELYCLPEMVPFYENWSFTSKLGSLKFLRRTVSEDQ